MKQPKFQSSTSWPPSRELQRFRDLGMLRDPFFERLWSFWQFSPDDPQLNEFISEKLAEAETLAILRPDPFRVSAPLPHEAFPGEIFMGALPSGASWCIPVKSLTTHVGVFGRAGGGKTNAIKLVLAQILEFKKCSA